MDSLDLIDLATRLISQLGFPIFVAIWLLLRTDRLISSLNTTIALVQLTLEALRGEIAATHESMRARNHPARRNS